MQNNLNYKDKIKKKMNVIYIYTPKYFVQTKKLVV